MIETPPDLSPEAVAGLRDRLLSTFVAQVFMGLVHGDPHEGNFLIMMDGLTIALLDYGLSLGVSWRHFAAPLAVLRGALTGKPKVMAKALVEMSAAHETMTPAESKAAVERVEKSFGEFFREVESKASELQGGRIERRFRLTLERLGHAVDKAWNSEDLTPAPFYLLMTKAMLEMAGNIGAIEAGTDVPKKRLRSGARILRQIQVHRSPLAPAPILRMVKARKVARLNAEARAVEVDAVEAPRPRASADDLLRRAFSPPK
jgi:hypothetical protein